MAQILINYQVQYKASAKDKNWNIWCTDKDLERIKRMAATFRQTKQPCRVLEYHTTITVLE